eukprot:Gb_33396 [translate_table: standard]
MMIMIMARVSLLSHPLSSCCCSPCALKMHLGRKETIRKLTSSIVWEQTNSITLPRDSICSPLHFRRMPCTLKSTGMAVSAGNMRTSPTFNGISTGRVAFSVGGAQADVPAISGENREILVQHILVPEDQIKLLLELQQRIVRDETIRVAAVSLEAEEHAMPFLSSKHRKEILLEWLKIAGR